MRILVTGSRGQVVRSLMRCGAATGHEIIALGRPQLDLAGDAGTIVSALESVRPDAIISAAAYTAVDKAEGEPEMAFAVNASGVAAVARAAQGMKVPLLHLSTDYVFDGLKVDPYVESDQPSPASVYGASKLAGEEAALSEHDDAIVLRTSWVYSPFGSNFVRTMLDLARRREELSVVDDQHGNPTSAADIADALLAIAANLISEKSTELRGVFHMTGAASATWAQFAEALFGYSAQLGGPTAIVRKIGTADYPTHARRPRNSRLDCSKLLARHGVSLPDWRQSAPGVVRQLLADV